MSENIQKDWRQKIVWINVGSATISKSGKTLNIYIKATQIRYIVDLQKLQKLIAGELEYTDVRQAQ